MPDARDGILLDFPGAQVTKRRPAVVISSKEYHASRPDMVVGLISSQTGRASGVTDHALSDWSAAGLNVPSAFRAFLATVPKTSGNIIGRLSQADWTAIQTCLKRALDLG